MAPAWISPYAVLAGEPQAISSQARENLSWHSLVLPHRVRCRVQAAAESKQKVQSPRRHFVPACALFWYFTMFLCVACEHGLAQLSSAQHACGLDGYASAPDRYLHQMARAVIPGLVHWPRLSFSACSPLTSQCGETPGGCLAGRLISSPNSQRSAGLYAAQIGKTRRAAGGQGCRGPWVYLS